MLKFRGAGQGPKALAAEIVAGEAARALGLPVPELVLVDLDPALGAAEPDPEIQDLIAASDGINFGMDFLPGALPFTPARPPEPDLAADIVWFDSFVLNVDRTPHNPNLLLWHQRLWLIDHGAALYVHHAPGDAVARAGERFPAIRDHVLLPFAGSIVEADARLAPRLDAARLEAIAGDVPDAWAPREAYAAHLAARLEDRAGSWRRRSPPVAEPFQYAMLRVIPRVERGEALNAGVALFCRPLRYLGARAELDAALLAVLAPGCDPGEIRAQLDTLVAVAEGRPEGGKVASLPQSDRFHWITSPASTIVQPSPVHTGLTTDPAGELDKLFEALVRR